MGGNGWDSFLFSVSKKSGSALVFSAFVRGFMNTYLGFGETILKTGFKKQVLKTWFLLIERIHVILERELFIETRDSNWLNKFFPILKMFSLH